VGIEHKIAVVASTSQSMRPHLSVSISTGTAGLLPQPFVSVVV
jgi:hypothetical protein